MVEFSKSFTIESSVLNLFCSSGAMMHVNIILLRSEAKDKKHIIHFSQFNANVPFSAEPDQNTVNSDLTMIE